MLRTGGMEHGSAGKRAEKETENSSTGAAQISVTVEDPGALLDADTPEAYEKLKLLL